ncbi:winged helix-turn-helix domain-containing protein [Streptomyces iconiensis]|uniref:Winged helix-turn-helix domain-containing protein n=1 Tax=Streptomyces iconiensis TaxID=1384038 RepID=A0ABT7A3G7_9ACTN|nr:winged helix-turn-helix domain-containing protein [Streptomyces iconiensis]MDJ1135888.1 winged helix-turn-helix domain-containing protein [Streptomyces iconiensis]
MTRKRDSSNGRRPRDVVADTLRERIRNGEFEPGARLPTQRELETEFGVSRSAVREALAALAQDGLLEGIGRGASPTVAIHARPGDAPRTAGTELGERLYAAFQADHVTIDAFSLTTETLNNALSRPQVDIIEGTLAPESVTIRILIPSLGARLALPRLMSGPDDPRPLDRLHEMQRTYTKTLELMLRTMGDRSRVGEVRFEIRTVPITPTHKLYLLNSTEALMGYYPVLADQEVEFRGDQLTIYDVRGVESRLFRFSSGADSRDDQEAAFVEESQLFFESLWSTIAKPFSPD